MWAGFGGSLCLQVWIAEQRLSVKQQYCCANATEGRCAGVERSPDGGPVLRLHVFTQVGSVWLNAQPICIFYSCTQVDAIRFDRSVLLRNWIVEACGVGSCA